MKLKRKQKWILSLVVTFSMLSSTMGMAAAAEPTQSDEQPVITTDAETEPTLVTTVNEAGTGAETGEDTEEDIQEEPEKNAEEDPEEDPEKNAEEDPEEDPEKNAEEDPEEDPEKNAEEDPEEDPEKNAEEDPEEDPEKNAEEDPEEDPEKNAEEDPEEDPEKNAEKDPEEESEEDDLFRDPDDGLLVVLEDPDAELPEELVSDVHEHSYNNYGVCVDCGYDAMEGIAVVSEGVIPTYKEAYEAMTALKDTYPEGMTWTNFEPYGSRGQLGDAYTWKGGAIYGADSAVGCMAFTFVLSDAAFGNLPARAIENGSFTFEDVKVGDILRVNGNSHSVIVLQKSAGGVVVAEGNYNKSVHWGRVMSAADVMNADFIITRYPKGYVPWDADDSAAGILGEGDAGGLKWSVTEAGVLTVSGNGAIPNYSSDNLSPWSQFSVSTIVIEAGVTGIGDYAFYGSGALSAYIPDSVTEIRGNAFDKSALISVTIPGSVKTIGDNAFYNCANLTSATVSEGVTTIGNEAFRGCTALTYIDFPSSITSVGTGAFTSCEKMVSVRFVPGSNMVALGDNLFTQCWNLTKVTLPQTADRITAGMFESCISLPELYIPASVQEIGEGAFYKCDALQVIYFGGSESEWESMMNSYLRPTLASIKIVFDAEFDDPFAEDPNNPSDFVPGESESCTNHVDADRDGKCDICGETMSTDNPDSGNNEDKTDSDGGEKVPSGSGGGSSSASGSSGSSSGSSGNSSGNSGNSSGSSSSSSGSSGSSSGSSGNSSGSSGSSSDDSNSVSGSDNYGGANTENSAELGNRPQSRTSFVNDESAKDRWEVIKEESDKAEDESTIIVDMNGANIVPGDVLENICGRDITLVFDMGNSITWSVNGNSVKEGEISDIDFSVQRDTEMIPVDVIGKVIGESYCIQISLAHEGEFGFTSVLSIDLGKENAGYTASLYYYNENTGELEFISEDTVAEDGMASLSFTHASDYVIAIDREQEESESVTEPAQPETPDEDSAGAAKEPQNTQPQRPWWLIMAGALVIIIGIAVFFVIRRKKEDESSH